MKKIKTISGNAWIASIQDRCTISGMMLFLLFYSNISCNARSPKDMSKTPNTSPVALPQDEIIVKLLINTLEHRKSELLKATPRMASNPDDFNRDAQNPIIASDVFASLACEINECCDIRVYSVNSIPHISNDHARDWMSGFVVRTKITRADGKKIHRYDLASNPTISTIFSYPTQQFLKGSQNAPLVVLKGTKLIIPISLLDYYDCVDRAKLEEGEYQCVATLSYSKFPSGERIDITTKPISFAITKEQLADANFK